MYCVDVGHIVICNLTIQYIVGYVGMVGNMRLTNYKSTKYIEKAMQYNLCTCAF